MNLLRYHYCHIVCLSLLSFAPLPISAQEHSRFQLEMELGPIWQERNKVQIPNDASSDRYSLTDLAGNGPWLSTRLNLNWNLSGAHGLRLVLAPLSYTETGLLPESTQYAGSLFSNQSPVEAEYKFNSWRFGYRYQFHQSDRWQFWVGATAKIRDAKIELRQAGTSALDDDLGFVPLLYLAGDYQINERWSFRFDFDGLAGGPGRAFDISMKLGYRLNDRWRISAGYRGLEGGVDSDEVYNFAWFNSALVAMEYRF